MKKLLTNEQTDDGGKMNDEFEEMAIPERTTMTGAAAFFGVSRSTLSGWRSTDKARFPKADARGLFDTLELGRYLEWRELSRTTATDYQAMRRLAADRLEQHIESGLFPGAMAVRCKRIVADMRSGDPDQARRARIAEIETQLLTGGGL
jgi:hypothetical protein